MDRFVTLAACQSLFDQDALKLFDLSFQGSDPQIGVVGLEVAVLEAGACPAAGKVRLLCNSQVSLVLFVEVGGSGLFRQHPIIVYLWIQIILDRGDHSLLVAFVPNIAHFIRKTLHYVLPGGRLGHFLLEECINVLVI